MMIARFGHRIVEESEHTRVKRTRTRIRAQVRTQVRRCGDALVARRWDPSCPSNAFDSTNS